MRKIRHQHAPRSGTAACTVDLHHRAVFRGNLVSNKVSDKLPVYTLPKSHYSASTNSQMIYNGRFDLAGNDGVTSDLDHGTHTSSDL